jgi:hypothetical protein
MANSYSTNPIVLDTFGADIDLRLLCGFAVDTPFFVNSIIWETPTNLTHTALITDKTSGRIIFSEQCSLVNASIINYYYGMPVANIFIAAGGVGSGKIIINLV